MGDNPNTTLNIAIATIAEVDDNVAVAVPFACWHRAVARQVLPSSSWLGGQIFSEEPHDFETAKVRVGLLSTAAEASVVFDEAAKIFPNC